MFSDFSLPMISHVSVTFFLSYFCCMGSAEELEKGRITVEKKQLEIA